MAIREKNDEKNPDPFSLPDTKGLQSYWVAKNTWSIDGLPGVRHIAHKATKQIVGQALKECGLSFEAINQRGSTTDWPVVLLIGVLLGFLFAIVLQNATGTLTSSVVSHACFGNHCLFTS